MLYLQYKVLFIILLKSFLGFYKLISLHNDTQRVKYKNIIMYDVISLITLN